MKVDLNTIAKNAEKIFYRLRWSGGIACPDCGSTHIYNIEAGKLHICADCKYRFSDTSNTIFHSTKLSLSKWLYAIYFFAETTRGVSSYSLSRLIGVSQSTAWSMLKRIRTAIKHDISLPEGAILDEVFLGADWKRIPSFKKYQKANAPKAVWNLKGQALRDYYKSEFYRLAAEDKMPVLGISGISEHSLILLSINTPDRKEFVRSELNHIYGHLRPHYKPELVKKLPYMTKIAHETHIKPVIITDHGKCYSCVNEFFTEDNQQLFQHEVCRHDKNRYKSANGYSSNRVESAFAHLKRMWRGTYQRWSRKYNQAYLNEFAWKYTHSSEKLITRLTMLFNYFDPKIVRI